MNRSELITMLEHFGYQKQAVSGDHSFFFNTKKNSKVIFAAMRSDEKVPELTFTGITNTLLYNKAATPKELKEYIERKKKYKRRRHFSKKISAKKKK